MTSLASTWDTALHIVDAYSLKIESEMNTQRATRSTWLFDCWWCVSSATDQILGCLYMIFRGWVRSTPKVILSTCSTSCSGVCCRLLWFPARWLELLLITGYQQWPKLKIIQNKTFPQKKLQQIKFDQIISKVMAANSAKFKNFNSNNKIQKTHFLMVNGAILAVIPYL